MYGTYGVCKIVDITMKDFLGTQKEYYVLKPSGDETSTLFVPMHNEKMIKKMRRILSEKEVYQLIEAMPLEEASWIENENIRKEEYRKIISQGNHIALIRMIKAIYLQKLKREAEGKHLYISDERFFKEAERILYDEFQYVLNIKREELLPFIFRKIESDRT